MFFKQFYDEDLAQSSYMIGCQSEGTAIVIDPRRDIGAYLAEAEEQNLEVTAVTETHIHADYLSGSRELAHVAGAQLYLSDEGDAEWKYELGGTPLRDGDVIRLGNVRIEAMHTPGHTPEHLSLLVTDLAASDVPSIVLTGDFVFVGDVGRPDLLDEAAGFVDTRFAGAEALFRSLRDRFLSLPDHVQVWPGHGAGSACGKALGAVPSSTVGYERLTAWWSRYVLSDDRAGFVDELLAGQPDAPAYFGRMKRENKRGPTILGDRSELHELSPRDLAPRLGRDALLIDTRPADRFREDTVAGSLHVPAGKKFVTYASYAIDPEVDTQEIVLLAPSRADAEEMRDRLSRIGVDRVTGYVTTLGGLPRDPIAAVEPSKLEHVRDAFVLDVRTQSEYAEGHIPGAHRIYVGRLRKQLAYVPRDRPVVVHCQGGARAAVAEGILHAAGFHDVRDLRGSYAAWKDAHASPA